ncbi:MAG: EVE domain-containing protein [Bacteroidota bacterium]
MNHWLVKSEPEAYSWQQFQQEGKAVWDGVRNYQARNNLKEMKKDDLVLFYHSVSEKRVMGIARVVREYYQDPTTDDQRWVAVDLAPEKALPHPITLEQVKNDDRLENIALVKQSRLSVMPLSREEFDVIVQLAYDQ